MVRRVSRRMPCTASRAPRLGHSLAQAPQGLPALGADPPCDRFAQFRLPRMRMSGTDGTCLPPRAGRLGEELLLELIGNVHRQVGRVGPRNGYAGDARVTGLLEPERALPLRDTGRP